MTWDTLEEILPSDVPHFDTDQKKLVKDMRTAGWRGRRTSKGHLLMMSPDGAATMTIAPTATRNRGGNNSRADFARWQRQQGDPVAQKPETESQPIELTDPEFQCPTCKRTFKNQRGLSIHRSKHQRRREQCPKCGRVFAYLETHMRTAHAIDTHKTLDDVMEAFAELDRLREENVELRAEIDRLRDAQIPTEND